MSGETSLYIHVPFCSKKCPYCHFFVLPDSSEGKEFFLRSFQLEWALRNPFLDNKKIISIYFGGGTPSLLGPKAIEEILKWIHQGPGTIDPSCEITLEANPEKTDQSLMREFLQAGINRVSLGVQSLHDPLLKRLGRTHGSEEAKQAVLATFDAGIHNISIDLMYDLPGQTLAEWEHSVQEALKLPISHLSLYNLVFEPGTVFYKKRSRLQQALPSAEDSLQMLHFAVDHMERAGLARYEISAFAKKNKHSVHNTGYWKARPFLGLGPSAFSYVEGRRFQNIPHLKKWGEALRQGLFPEGFEETLDPEAKQKELLAIELRLLQGVDLSLFQTQNGPLCVSLQRSIQDLLAKELIQERDGRLFLSKEGLDFYDTVAIELM